MEPTINGYRGTGACCNTQLTTIWTVLLLYIRTMVTDEKLRIGTRKIPGRPAGYARLEEPITGRQAESSNSMSARLLVLSMASMA